MPSLWDMIYDPAMLTSCKMKCVGCDIALVSNVFCRSTFFSSLLCSRDCNYSYKLSIILDVYFLHLSKAYR